MDRGIEGSIANRSDDNKMLGDTQAARFGECVRDDNSGCVLRFTGGNRLRSWILSLAEKEIENKHLKLWMKMGFWFFHENRVRSASRALASSTTTVAI